MSQKNETVAVVSPFSATVALFCDSRCFRRQIVALFCVSVDRALAVTLNNASDKQAVRLSNYHSIVWFLSSVLFLEKVFEVVLAQRSLSRKCSAVIPL